MPEASRLLGLELLLGQRIGQDATDRDGRANLALRIEDAAKADDTVKDEDDALDRVAHRVGDRVHLVEDVEGDFVVQIECEATANNAEGEVSGSHALGHRLVPLRLQFRALDGKGDGEDREEGEGGHDGEGVARVFHVLSLRLLPRHRFLGEDATEREGEVGAHRKRKAIPGEAQIGRGRDADATDDWKQADVDLPRQDVVHEDGTENHIEKRLE
mmetsp:Transcript_20495/g.52172  ORF Transcript_20495/g.52172 Transcript_20495/m.52172 type:complete len:215 (+) Transcript_20495:380-1024(+)